MTSFVVGRVEMEYRTNEFAAIRHKVRLQLLCNQLADKYLDSSVCVSPEDFDSLTGTDNSTF